MARTTKLSSFTDIEIQKAITDTVGERPHFMPSIKVMRVIATELAKHYPTPRDHEAHIASVVDACAERCTIRAGMLSLYRDTTKRLLNNRLRIGRIKRSSYDRRAPRPQMQMSMTPSTA